MKVEVAAFGSLSLKSLMVSVDVKQHLKKKTKRIEQSSGAVSKSRWLRPVLPVLNAIIAMHKPDGFCGREATFEEDSHEAYRTEFRSCVKVEVAVLFSPSLTIITMISLMVSVDVKQL